MNSHSFLNPIKHDRSKYILDKENDKILDHVQNTNGISISTAIVQLFMSKRPDNSEWFKHSTGIICLVKDYNIKSFFFRLFSLKAQLLWEEEISTHFSYHKLTNNFYYFPGYVCNVGFNFAFADEAFKFQRSIIRAMNSLEKLDYLKKDSNNNNDNQITVNYNFTNRKRDSSKKAEKKIIDKNLIGKPKDFVHVNHIGLSEDNSFNILLNDQNEHVRMIVDVLKQLNIKPSLHSVEYADSFIKSNGGYSKYFKEHKKRYAPKPPKFESKSDIPKKNPKLLISNFDETKYENQSSKQIVNLTVTPNTLKPPSRPPPKPPVYQCEQNKTQNISANGKQINFLSPISNVKYNSDCSNYATPEQSMETNQNLNKIETRKTNSAISHDEHRNALLKSIEDFKGGLKRVVHKETLKITKDDPMSDLINALKQMRPYLNQSSDESEEEDNFSF